MLKANKNKIIKLWAGLIESSVFYAPVLGPVYTSDNDPEQLLSAIIDNAESDTFLKYDRNKRWFENKNEKIFLDLLVAEKDKLFITSYDSFFKVLRIYYYSNYTFSKKTLPIVKGIIDQAKKKQNFLHCDLYCFSKPNDFSEFKINNIYLKKITDSDRSLQGSNNISEYNELNKKEQITFSNFSKEEEHDGLNFIWEEYLNKHKPLKPIFCYVHDKKIVGAIGPLDISMDIYGASFLQPPFFGVLKKFQQKGIGNLLWKTAMKYAFEKQAKYTMVQNTPDSSAGKFYERQGLTVGSQVLIIRLNINI